MILDSDDTVFIVVVNQEEQYSIWPAELSLPAGWQPTGISGPKAQCLEYIEQVWTDMRPRSLRAFMAENHAV